MIFTAYLKRNEAIRVRGARRYASHSGYGETFTFEGDFPNAAKLYLRQHPFLLTHTEILWLLMQQYLADIPTNKFCSIYHSVYSVT